MDALTHTQDLFFHRPGLDPAVVQRILAETLANLDDGELFFEFSEVDSVVLDMSEIRAATYSSEQGFGLRGVLGTQVAYAHAGDLSEGALRRAAETCAALFKGKSGTRDLMPGGTNAALYSGDRPDDLTLVEKIAALNTIDIKARAADPRVVQVTASIVTSFQAVRIERLGAAPVADLRPLCRLSLSVTLEKDGKREQGSYGWGGRESISAFIADAQWDAALKAALHQAEVNLAAVPAPAGTLPLVLGAGWPGVMLHEAVGHGLEGDFNRKGSSIYSGKMGEQVAAKGVTVIDDGTMIGRRGSLTIDDEGTPSAENVLIEDGRLVGYMQDRQNARLMGQRPTGNGRRESYAHQPMPRMTNTYMAGGDHDPGEIIASVKDGIYAPNFGGGQVDIVSGQFTFKCTEAYRIRDGKISEPIKGATIVGNGPEAMSQVSMIGNDMALDSGIGTCGKAGQGVPVGIGQPTIKMDAMTIGGTA